MSPNVKIISTNHEEVDAQHLLYFPVMPCNVYSIHVID